MASGVIFSGVVTVEGVDVNELSAQGLDLIEMAYRLQCDPRGVARELASFGRISRIVDPTNPHDILLLGAICTELGIRLGWDSTDSVDAALRNRTDAVPTHRELAVR